MQLTISSFCAGPVSSPELAAAASNNDARPPEPNPFEPSVIAELRDLAVAACVRLEPLPTDQVHPKVRADDISPVGGGILPSCSSVRNRVRAK